MANMIQDFVVLAVTLLMLPTFATASNNTSCPTSCQCIIASDSLTIHCRHRMPNVERLSKQLDSLLSAEHNIEHLESLNITDTPLTQLPEAMCQLRNLASLNVDRNELQNLPNHCLYKLAKLVLFSAANNCITDLQDGLFDGLQKLRSINLTKNRIGYIGLRVFSNSSHLNSLRIIDLSENRLTSLEPWWYYRCIVGTESSPVHIDLSSNMIANFTNQMKFTYNCGMKAVFGNIDLSINRMVHISDMLSGWNLTFDSLLCLASPSPITIHINHQSFACDCKDFEFYAWAKPFHFLNMHFMSEVRCSALSDYGSALAITVPLSEFVCVLTDGCPSGCQCVNRPANATLHVDCSASNLSSLPLDLPSLPKSYTRYKLDFSNNKLLRRLEYRTYFNHTAILNVSNCSINYIDTDAWQGFAKMQSPFVTPQVLLEHNGMKSIPPEITSVNFTSIHFSLNNNPWKCSCETHYMIVWFNSLSFVSSNGDDVLCGSPARLKGRNIVHSTRNDFCVDPTVTRLKIGLSSALSVAALLVSVATIYRLRVRIYGRFKFHPFDRDECGGENMNYDAFLCCSSEDHNPHGKHIMELLESKGYRVCYHLRDFLAGQSIADSMLEAIVSSKRTICMISNNFLQSAYCMTEFDMAFYHLVAVKRKKRLIVLMMLDSLNDLYATDASDTATLRHHVLQYTYIDYKADDWLDKLLYALPFHGLLQTNQQNNDDDVQLLADFQPSSADTSDGDALLIDS